MYAKYLIIITGALCAESTWQLPSSNLRYDQVTFLTSHNSFAAVKHGYLLPQQVWSMRKQLANGVRALMLDIYLDSGIMGIKGERIGLCHGNCSVTRYLLTAPGAGVKTLATALKDVKTFLDANKHEIVTIFLEDYVKDRVKLDRVINEVGLGSLVLKPADWDPVARQGWPTLGWMQQHNKRLVFFTDKRKSASQIGGGLRAEDNPVHDTAYAYYVWSNVKESDFSTLQKERIAQERKQSQNNATSSVNAEGIRYLYLMNFFPDFILPTKKSDMSWSEVKSRTGYSKTNSQQLRETLAYVVNKNNGRYPNFIGVDFVNWGDPLALVNEINAQAARASVQERERMYAPLQAAPVTAPARRR